MLVYFMVLITEEVGLLKKIKKHDNMTYFITPKKKRDIIHLDIN